MEETLGQILKAKVILRHRSVLLQETISMSMLKSRQLVPPGGLYNKAVLSSVLISVKAQL